MIPIGITFPIISPNPDEQRIWEENIVAHVRKIAGVDVKPTYADPDYHSYLKSQIWDEKRKEVIGTYDEECYFCGAVSNIHIHHISYLNMGQEQSGDLIPLCADCHKRLHDLKDEMTPIIDDVKNSIAKDLNKCLAMRRIASDNADSIIKNNTEIIKMAIERYIPKVIAGHKNKIASVIGNTLFYDLLGHACPINKDFIKVLKGIKKK